MSLSHTLLHVLSLSAPSCHSEHGKNNNQHRLGCISANCCCRLSCLIKTSTTVAPLLTFSLPLHWKKSHAIVQAQKVQYNGFWFADRYSYTIQYHLFINYVPYFLHKRCSQVFCLVHCEFFSFHHSGYPLNVHGLSLFLFA